MDNNYGSFINSTNGVTTGENTDNILNGMPQEKADSLAGAIKNPGYVGGFFGTTNSNENAQVQQVNTYVMNSDSMPSDSAINEQIAKYYQEGISLVKSDIAGSGN